MIAVTLAELTKFLESELSLLGLEDSECRAECDLILTHLSGWRQAERLRRAEQELDNSLLARAREIIERRKQREPIQYCLGETYFYGLRFLLRPGVLIPRADTETLVEAAVKHFKGRFGAKSEFHIGEIGIGSGIISIAFLKQLPNATISACDISSDAISVAADNAALHNVSARLKIDCCDWKGWLGSQSKLEGVLANPPYIPASLRETLAAEVKDWEPAVALFGGGDDGLGFYRDFARLAPAALAEGGTVFLEIGFDQSEAVKDIFMGCGWAHAGTYMDLNGIARVLSFNS